MLFTYNFWKFICNVKVLTFINFQRERGLITLASPLMTNSTFSAKLYHINMFLNTNVENTKSIKAKYAWRVYLYYVEK